jgi:rod shape-determining protein MreD
MSGRGWQYWALVIFLVALYFGLHLALGLGGWVPDLLTVAVLLAARRSSAPVATAVGFTLGVLRDSLSLVAFGADAIVLTVLGYLGSRSRDLFLGDSLLFMAAYLLAGKALHDGLYALLAGPALGSASVERLLVELPLVLYAAAAGFAALLLYRVVSGER